MMYFKACPKCHGDLVSGGDMHGDYVSCFQCGYMRDVPAEGVRKTGPKTEVLVIDAPKAAGKRKKRVRQAA